MIAGTARRRDTSVRMRGSTPGPAPSECHDIVFQDGARSQGVHLQRDLRLAEVNACMPRVSATSNQDTMGRHLWVERGNSVWVVCFAQEFDSARVKVLAFATWYALVCENLTDDDTLAGWRARDGDTPPNSLYAVSTHGTLESGVSRVRGHREGEGPEALSARYLTSESEIMAKVPFATPTMQAILSVDRDTPPWSAYPDGLLDGDPEQRGKASSCAHDAKVLELTEQGWWCGSGRHLADKTEGSKAKLCYIIPPLPRTAKLQARRQRGTGKSEFRCYPTAALDDCVLNATSAGVDALMRLSCANADCAEQLEWMEQQLLALQNLKQEQEAEIQGLKNQKALERHKILEREREERQKRADCTRFLLEQLHADKSTHPKQAASPESGQPTVQPGPTLEKAGLGEVVLGEQVLQPTEHKFKDHVRTSSTYLVPYTLLASEVLQVQNGPWQGARFRCGEMSGWCTLERERERERSWRERERESEGGKGERGGGGGGGGSKRESERGRR